MMLFDIPVRIFTIPGYLTSIRPALSIAVDSPPSFLLSFILF